MYAENMPAAMPIEPDEIIAADDPRYVLLSVRFSAQGLAETMEQAAGDMDTAIRQVDESRRRYSLSIFIATAAMGVGSSMNAAVEALQNRPVQSGILSAASIAIWYMGHKTFRISRQRTIVN